jgi:hypothetical protein
MSDFDIEEELLKINYCYIYGVNIALLFSGYGLGQHKEYLTQKHKNVLLLFGVTFFHGKNISIKDGK